MKDKSFYQTVREDILRKIELEKELEDEQLQEIIIEELVRNEQRYPLSLKERKNYATALFHSFRRLGILQELIDQETVTEILVNGSNHIFYEREGELYHWDKSFENKEELLDLIQMICAAGNRMVNEASPIVDTRLGDGSRVNIVLEPIAVDGAAISIRKFSKEPMTMKRLVEKNALSWDMVEFLKKLVISGYNIFVSGGTGSGKTTFLNALSEFIPIEERVITIEDSAELQLKHTPNLVRLETRAASFEGIREISIRDLIKTALRMRPNRIIVGECRGPEALDLLNAFNTGHSGGLGTGHANNSRDMLKRLETMVLMGMDLPIPAIRAQICSGLDILIHLGRLRDRSRKVLEITELSEIQNGEIHLNPIYSFKESGEEEGRICASWEKVGELRHQGKLFQAGFCRIN